MMTDTSSQSGFTTESPTWFKLLRFWHLLPLPLFVYGWLAQLHVRANNPYLTIRDDDVFTGLIGIAILVLISLAIYVARRLRQAERSAWRWTGYGLTTLAIPTWLLGLLLSCGYAVLNGQSLHIGC